MTFEQQMPVHGRLHQTPQLNYEYGSLSSFRMYLLSLSDQRLLTAEEEIVLAKRIETGNAARGEIEELTFQGIEPSDRLTSTMHDGLAAKRTLFLANTRLVIGAIKKYRNPNDDFALDLIQEGNIGLMTAIDKFDWRRETRFSTHAVWWIQQAMFNAVRKQDSRVGVSARDYNYRLQVLKTIDLAQSTLGRLPTEEEVAELSSFSVETVRLLLASLNSFLSLDEVVQPGSDVTYHERLPAPDSVEDTTFAHLLEEEVSNILANLDERERVVLRMRYGFGDHSEHSFAKIGATLNLTRERIRQIHNEALAKIRNIPDVFAMLLPYLDER